MTPSPEDQVDDEDATQQPASEPSLRPGPEVPSALVDLVEELKSDLSERINVDADQIEVVVIREVVWRDSSLGCPQPGMNYLMVLTDGYQILLKADGKEYAYHTRGTSQYVFCEDAPPLESTTLDTK